MDLFYIFVSVDRLVGIIETRSLRRYCIDILCVVKIDELGTRDAYV